LKSNLTQGICGKLDPDNRIIAAAVSIGSRLLTTAVIEKVAIALLERLVKLSKSTFDDELLAIVKDELSM
jgi:hypothetical protein